MTGEPALPERVRIREVGLRDGLQIEAPIPTAQKLELLGALVAAGARRIEATAFVSPRAVPALADADAVAARLGEFPDVDFSALVANVRGAERAVAAGITTIEYVVSAADSHSVANARVPTDVALARVAEIADIAHRAGGECEVIVAVAWDDPTEGPSPPEQVVALARQAVRLGADRLCLGDTIGTVTPLRLTRLVRAVREVAGPVEVGVHLHDTRGTGLASAFAAMQIGVVDIDASIGGLGGCPFAPGASGNIATEELAYLCRDSGVGTGLDIERLIAAAALAQEFVGRSLRSGVLRAGDRIRVPRNNSGKSTESVASTESVG